MAKKIVSAKFRGTLVRRLEVNERSMPTGKRSPQFPLVIEPGNSSRSTELPEFLNDNSQKVLESLHRFGAVLLRGWDVTTERDFERAILNIQGILPFKRHFKIEADRRKVPGTRFVFHTSTAVKTGGSFQVPGRFFHSENFYHPEVPAYQFFWSKKSSLLGGETAIVDMQSAYSRLPQSVKVRLESARVFARSWPLRQMARMYGRSESALEKTILKLGMEIGESDGRKHIMLFKPPVLEHPFSGKRSLQISFKELREVVRQMTQRFMPFFSGAEWAIHRAAWTNSGLLELLTSIDEAGLEVAEKVFDMPASFDRFRIDRRLNQNQSARMAKVMMEHTAIFQWKPGDILMLDNLQTLHCGMPGFGPRELRVMLSNPVHLDLRNPSGVGRPTKV